MIRKPITIIEEREKYIEIEFWNPEKNWYNFLGALLCTLFFIIIGLVGIQNIVHIEWVSTGIILIGLPLSITILEYLANKYPWVLKIDVTNNKISCSGHTIRTYNWKYDLTNLEKIEIIQYIEKVPLKELIKVKPQKELFVKKLNFNLGNRQLYVLKISTTIEEWMNVLKKIDLFLMNNNYNVKIPEIQ